VTVLYKATVALGFLLLILGYIDCLTTVIGTTFLSCTELNPLIHELVHTNIAAFVIIKLVSGLVVAGIAIVADNFLGRYRWASNSVLVAQKAIRMAYTCMLAIAALVVMNNIYIIIK
jgi:hypothetical protein